MGEPVKLFETMLFEPGTGVFLLDRHLDRIEASARELDFDFSRKATSGEVAGAIEALPEASRVKLLLSESGECEFEVTAIRALGPAPAKVALAAAAVKSGDWRLRHKTTDRSVYDAARAGRPGFDDVILYNERGEVTESTIANVVVDMGGGRVTPPLSCGLLPGTFRAELLARGEIREGLIRAADLSRAERLWLVNSLRTWMPVVVGR